MEGGHYSEHPLCGEFALIAKKVLVSCSLATASDFLYFFFPALRRPCSFPFNLESQGEDGLKKRVINKCRFYGCIYCQILRKRQLNCSFVLSRMF